MKYLKTYENIMKPKVGDFVIINRYDYFDFPEKFTNFLNKSIGYIFKQPSENYYLVKYFNIPDEIKEFFVYSDYSEGIKKGNSILSNRNEIKYWSKNEENLEKYLITDKYNL